jgi:hypothetical protein
VQIVYDTCFVQVCELGHVVCFVEFRRIDLVYTVGGDIALLQKLLACYTSLNTLRETHGAILALCLEHTTRQLFNNPALDECLLVIAHPDVPFARQVVLALRDANIFSRPVYVLRLDKLGRKGP